MTKPNFDMKEFLIQSIIQAQSDLIKSDWLLVKPGCCIPVDKHDLKLHEVCINHRFAIYLERTISECPSLIGYSIDIEYNRYGNDVKRSPDCKPIRPDVIVHKRRDNGQSENLLVIEAKMADGHNNDEARIRMMMSDDGIFKYRFGAKLTYNEFTNAECRFYSKPEVDRPEIIYFNQHF